MDVNRVDMWKEIGSQLKVVFVVILHISWIIGGCSTPLNVTISVVVHDRKNETASIKSDAPTRSINAIDDLEDHFQMENDMLLTSKQYNMLYEREHSIERSEPGFALFNGVRNIFRRWPNNTLNYHINGTFSEYQLGVIAWAMDHIKSQTCIKFRKLTTEEAAVTPHLSFIRENSGCVTNVGYSRTQKRRIILADNCFLIPGIIIHEILHSLGFTHMQNNYDRDDYVVIVWNHIQESMKINFKKYRKDMLDNFGVPYDYSSIMHYHSRAFLLKELRQDKTLKTIEPKNTTLASNLRMGQRRGMSKGDVEKVNRMYNCPGFEEYPDIDDPATDMEVDQRTVIDEPTTTSLQTPAQPMTSNSIRRDETPLSNISTNHSIANAIEPAPSTSRDFII